MKAVCWIAVAGFATGTVASGWEIQRALHPVHVPGFLGICGNCITDPLGQILGLGSPIGAVGLAGLVFLWSRDQVSAWAVGSAGTLVLGGTVAYLIFGLRLMHDIFGMPLSAVVWWLKPFGI